MIFAGIRKRCGKVTSYTVSLDIVYIFLNANISNGKATRARMQRLGIDLVSALSRALSVSGENMPKRDGTGPKGKGPRTGRKKGKC